MARLQILQLPEAVNDERPPFVLVVDQYMPLRYVQGDSQEPQPVNEFAGVAEQIGARGVLVFRESVDIPANAPIPLPDVADAEDAGITQIVYAHERTRLDLCNALLLSRDTTWRKLVEVATEGQREVAEAYRKLTAFEDARLRHKTALLDALGLDHTRDWDDIVNVASGLRKGRDARAAALERVRNLPDQPEATDSQHPDPSGYLHGYKVAIGDAKRAARSQAARSCEGGD